MPGKGKRRSARLLKLEEHKNDGGGDGDSAVVCLLDPWQIIRNNISGSSAARGKRKRNAERPQRSQGEASCSSHHQPSLPAAASSTKSPAPDNLSSQISSVGHVIEYILDELEMRDRHELFAMVDDIQVTDYAERVNRPGDFATLRQKNKDGMYTALQQFEASKYIALLSCLIGGSLPAAVALYVLVRESPYLVRLFVTGGTLLGFFFGVSGLIAGHLGSSRRTVLYTRLATLVVYIVLMSFFSAGVCTISSSGMHRITCGVVCSVLIAILVVMWILLDRQ